MKNFTNEQLIEEYKTVDMHIKHCMQDRKLYPDDEFLKAQCKESKEYRRRLIVELELRGLKR